MRRLFIVLLAALTSTCALGQTMEKQFDLICTGRMLEMFWNPTGREAPFRTELHVDLNTGSFCYDSCDDIYKLTSWNAHELSYSFDVEKTGRSREQDYWSDSADIDRFTVTFPGMKFRRVYEFERCMHCTAGQRYSERISGLCRKAPFSGLERRPDSDSNRPPPK